MRIRSKNDEQLVETSHVRAVGRCVFGAIPGGNDYIALGEYASEEMAIEVIKHMSRFFSYTPTATFVMPDERDGFLIEDR